MQSEITLRQAAQQALYVIEAWERDCDYDDYWRDRDDAITALRAALAEPDSDYERGFVDGMNLQTKGSVDKAVNRMAEPEQEPVAWRVQRSDGQYELYFLKASAERAAECYIKRPPVEPLYTALTPQPEQPHDLLCLCGAEWDIYSDGREELVAAPQWRKPLTDEQILKICQSFRLGYTDQDLARAIERAHGITGETK